MRALALAAVVLAASASAPSPAPVPLRHVTCDEQATHLDAYRTSLAAAVKTVDEAGAVAERMGVSSHAAGDATLRDAYEASATASRAAMDDLARDVDDRVAATYARAFHYVRSYAALLASFDESVDRTGAVDVPTIVGYGEMLPKPDDATAPIARIPWRAAKSLIAERRASVRALPDPTARAAEAAIELCRIGATTSRSRPCAAYENAVEPAVAELARALEIVRSLKSGVDASVPVAGRAELERARTAAAAAAGRAATDLAGIPPKLCADTERTSTRQRVLQEVARGITLEIGIMRAYAGGSSTPNLTQPTRSLLGNVLAIVENNLANKSAARAADAAVLMPWLRNTVDDLASLAGVAAAPA